MLVRRSLLVLGALALALSATGSRAVPLPHPDTDIFLYSTVNDMVAGNLWEVTTRDQIARDLRTRPQHWPVVGLGSTTESFHNGELIVFGKTAQPLLLWARPEYPQPVLPITDEQLPFAAVASCNPNNVIQAAAVADQPIHAQVQQLAASKNLSVAAVLVTGTFREVRGTIAYNLKKEGTPLFEPGTDTSKYTLPFYAPETTNWSLAGFYATTPDQKAQLTSPSANVHLHGARPDRTRGGHMSSALPVNARIQLFPARSIIAHKCDLTLRDLHVDGDKVVFTLVNAGNNGVAYAPVRGMVGETMVFKSLIANLGPGESRVVTVTPSWPDSGRHLQVQVDPDNDVFESDEGNNTAST